METDAVALLVRPRSAGLAQETAPAWTTRMCR